MPSVCFDLTTFRSVGEDQTPPVGALWEPSWLDAFLPNAGVNANVQLDSVRGSVSGSMTPLPDVGLSPGFPNFEDSAATDFGSRASSMSSDDAS
jgi:hypothetical protein